MQPRLRYGRRVDTGPHQKRFETPWTRSRSFTIGETSQSVSKRSSRILLEPRPGRLRMKSYSNKIVGLTFIFIKGEHYGRNS